MRILAIIESSVVANVIVAEPDFTPEGDFVDVTNAVPQPGPGWTYDGHNFSGGGVE